MSTQSSIRRIFVVVLDGVGAGELPDAAQYGDVGSNTLAHTAEAVGGLRLPTMGGPADVPHEVWVHAAVDVGSSEIAGRGLFATRALRRLAPDRLPLVPSCPA